MMRRNDFYCLISGNALALALLIAVLAPSALAQRTLIATSNDPEANLFVDGDWVGTASGESIRIPKGAQRLVVTSSRPDTWSISPLEFDLTAKPAGEPSGEPAGEEALRIDARFPYYYKVESIPFDVEVYAVVGGTEQLVGRTPLVFQRDEPLPNGMILRKAGYEDVAVKIASDGGTKIWNRVFTPMMRTESGLDASPTIEFESGPDRRRWVDALIAGAAITSGVMAVRYRAKADRLYDEYREGETDDPSLREEIKRLDAYSIASLGAMQVGVGVFVFRVAF